MGYHPNCAYQTCSLGCCNEYGFCPEDYSQDQYGTDYTSCYHYYDRNPQQPNNATVGYVILAGIIVTVALVAYVRRKRTVNK